MSLIPTSTMMTNELKLHDFKGTKASVTFGDADINDGYSYLKLNFRANDLKFDFWQDKPVFNIIAEEELTFNDKKVWHENNDGPMSGLNADMLDGLHASEFKDRNGHHHFGHAFKPGGKKMFVKIATFTPRRVGNCPDFNTNGTVPFQGVFVDNIVKRMDARAKFSAFVEDTPERLGPIGINGFEHTDMASEGVYNGTLRASISLLRKGDTKKDPWQGGDTIDIHIGIFEDPTNQDDDGWTATSRYFYMSAHERNLPFLKEKDDPNHTINDNGNVGPSPVDGYVREAKVEERVRPMLRAAVTPPTSEGHDCNRPPVNDDTYATPPDPSKNNYKPEEFPPIIQPGFGYQRDVDTFRLYHVASNVGTIDGVKVVTHKFELYMVVDTKMELRIQPYMSSSCLFYNYQKPIPESELPDGNYMNPRSVYDNRYSHVEHRHAGYEDKLERIDREIDEIWDCFDNYVVVEQGSRNANKVMMTNPQGKVVAIDNPMELHKDTRRVGERVVVTNKNKCIEESTITTKELAQLDGVRENIQEQIDDLEDSVGDLEGQMGDFVKKTGDTMTGDLFMKKNAEVKIYGSGRDMDPQYGMHVHANNGYAGLHDPYENNPMFGLDCESQGYYQRYMFFQKYSFTIGGRRSSGASRVTIQPYSPADARVGDIWIKNPETPSNSKNARMDESVGMEVPNE